MARNPKNLPVLKEIEVNRNSELDNFKFFFGGFRTNETLSNFILGGKFFENKNQLKTASAYALAGFLPMGINLSILLNYGEVFSDQ